MDQYARRLRSLFVLVDTPAKFPGTAVLYARLALDGAHRLVHADKEEAVRKGVCPAHKRRYLPKVNRPTVTNVVHSLMWKVSKTMNLDEIATFLHEYRSSRQCHPAEFDGNDKVVAATVWCFAVTMFLFCFALIVIGYCDGNALWEEIESPIQDKIRVHDQVTMIAEREEHSVPADFL